MKAKDIKEFEISESCFGKTIKVNGKEYSDLSKSQRFSFIHDMLLNDVNASNIMQETFENCLEYLQFDVVENSTSDCDQCGSYNSYVRYEKPD